MRSGGSRLRNPPGTEWHHPGGNVVELLRKNVHGHPELRLILHPGNKGGIARDFPK
jgi:hypothetical protein